MLQNPCKTLGFKNKYGLQNSPWGEVNHIQPVAYLESPPLPCRPKSRSNLFKTRLTACNAYRINDCLVCIDVN